MRKFSVCIWDILGELNNPDLTASYFKNAMGVIYVFDLTNEESLSNLKYWHDKVDEQIGIKRL